MRKGREGSRRLTPQTGRRSRSGEEAGAKSGAPDGPVPAGGRKPP